MPALANFLKISDSAVPRAENIAEFDAGQITKFSVCGKGLNSLSNLVRKFSPKPRRMQQQRGKEWDKLKKLPAWQMANEKSKREVIQKAQKKHRTVHFATLMDICHLKNAELEPKFQKHKGKVVLRGDIVKDDSGSHADCGSSASQMTAAK